MNKTIRFSLLMFLVFLFSALPFSAQKTDYQIGESEGGLLNDGKLKEAFEKAADKFKEWMYEGTPSGYVTRTDDYYMQTFTDGEDRAAAVYVGPDYNSYVLRGPIYEQLESVGGLKTMGRPISDAYEVNGAWYQNFDNGYATVNDSGKASFVSGQRVNEQGVVSSSTDSNVTDGTTDGTGTSSLGTTDNSATDGSVSSPSQMVSDVVSDVEEGTSRWGMWVFVLLVILAAVILLIYWFLKRK